MERSAAMQSLMGAADGASTWDEVHAWSCENKEAFWQHVVGPQGLNVKTRKPFSEVLLRDAELNIVESCFKGRGEDGADDMQLVALSHPDGQLTLGELEERTRAVVRGLRKMGVQPGACVGICMALGCDSITVYLGAIRFGVAVVSIAESFSTAEIALRARLGDIAAMFTQAQVHRGSKVFEHFDKVRAGVPEGVPCVVQAPVESTAMQASDISLEDFLNDQPLPAETLAAATRTAGDGGSEEAKAAEADATAVPPQPPSDTAEGASIPLPSADEYHIARADTTINVLFSSGTTADPKAIPWDHTTAIKAAMDGLYHLDIRPGDRVMFPTSLGWMMGPWLVFASLINRASMVVLSDVPTMENVGKLIEQYQVTHMGIVPSMVRGWRRTPVENHWDRWSSLRCYYSTGEASQYEDYYWLTQERIPVIEYCGGTEIGGGYVTGSFEQPQRLSQFSTPALGVRLHLRGDTGEWVPEGEAGEGEVFIEGPSLGLSQRLLNYDHDTVYFTNAPEKNGVRLRKHGDRLCRDAEGYYRAGGRADDAMNLGGIKVSSTEIERTCNPHPLVHETAAIGLAEGGAGPEELYLYIVLNEDGRNSTEEVDWKREMSTRIREHLNPLFRVKGAKVTTVLPRTSTNKIMRRKLREQLVQEMARENDSTPAVGAAAAPTSSSTA